VKFDVIYDFDLTREGRVGHYKPPHVQRWLLTETDECYEFDYLVDECGDKRYRGGKHRKYVAELTEKQFVEFIQGTGLYYEDIPTMGMIGGATGIGWQPAISFRGDSDGELIWQSAYVCPIPENGDAEMLGLLPLDDSNQETLVPLTEEDKARRSQHNWEKVVDYAVDILSY
jgi:hypothetical protein